MWWRGKPSVIVFVEFTSRDKFTRLSSVTVVDVDFCAFGKPFRKRTKIMLFNTSAASLVPYKCVGKGICSFTHRKHVELSGKDPKTNTFRTKLAEPYPRLLSDLLAAAFNNSRTYNRFQRLGSFM